MKARNPKMRMNPPRPASGIEWPGISRGSPLLLNLVEMVEMVGTVEMVDMVEMVTMIIIVVMMVIIRDPRAFMIIKVISAIIIVMVSSGAPCLNLVLC